MPFLNKKTKPFQRFCSLLVLTAFLWNVLKPPVLAATGLDLPEPGHRVGPSEKYTPILIRGISIDPDRPFKFGFIMDTGNSGLDIRSEEFKSETEKLVKYFLASLTIPEKEMWVNLSPYEKDRITSDSLGQTEMGRELLGQDYILKQLTASLMYPEDELGEKFWGEIYRKAYEEYGTTQVPVDTFNKVWIVPDKGVVYEHGRTAFVVEQHLKVMMEEDYFARNSGLGSRDSKQMFQNRAAETLPVPRDPIPANIIRQIILPEIEREVNEGTNFAPLRQIYNSMILAAWYKMNLKQSLLGQVYVDQNKLKGIETNSPELKDQIYDRYVAAFRKGVFSLIKEEEDLATGQTLPRKYFSGGIVGEASSALTVENQPQGEISSVGSSAMVGVEIVGNVKSEIKKKLSWIWKVVAEEDIELELSSKRYISLREVVVVIVSSIGLIWAVAPDMLTSFPDLSLDSEKSFLMGHGKQSPPIKNTPAGEATTVSRDNNQLKVQPPQPNMILSIPLHLGENPPDLRFWVEMVLQILAQNSNNNGGISQQSSSNNDDRASANSPLNESETSDPVGGIDLDSNLLDLQVRRDPNEEPLQMRFEPVGAMNIEGFSPVIINITPVEIPLLLGMKGSGEKESRTE